MLHPGGEEIEVSMEWVSVTRNTQELYEDINMNEHTKTWPELAIGLYDRLTGRNAEITYDFDNMEVSIPSGTGEQAEHAKWRLHGSLRIRTRDGAGS